MEGSKINCKRWYAEILILGFEEVTQESNMSRMQQPGNIRSRKIAEEIYLMYYGTIIDIKRVIASLGWFGKTVVSRPSMVEVRVQLVCD
jgi:hypothetical protein